MHTGILKQDFICTLISWLLGSKRNWIADQEIQAATSKSTIFANGSQHNGEVFSQQLCQRHLRQLISLCNIDIVFNIICTATFNNTYRTHKVSATGELFLRVYTEQSLQVLSPFIAPLEAKQTSTATRDLQKSFGVNMVPGKLSPAAANPE